MRKSALTRRKRNISVRSQKDQSFLRKVWNILFFAILVCVIGGTLWLGKEIFSSLQQASWKDQQQFNLLVFIPQGQDSQEQEMYFFSIGKGDRDSFIIRIPQDQPLSAWKQYGQFRSSALLSLYTMNDHPESYLTSQLAWQMGLVEHAVVHESSPYSTVISDRKTLLQYFSPTTWWERRAQISLTTQYKIWKALRAKRDNEVINASNTVSEFLAKSNESQLSKLSFLSQTVSPRQGTSVAIVNMTEINGLGNSIAETFSTLGFRVVHVSSEGLVENQHSRIIISDQSELLSEELGYIANFFPEPPQIEIDPQITAKYRTNFVVFFEKDFRGFVSGWDISP